MCALGRKRPKRRSPQPRPRSSRHNRFDAADDRVTAAKDAFHAAYADREGSGKDTPPGSPRAVGALVERLQRRVSEITERLDQIPLCTAARKAGPGEGGVARHLCVPKTCANWADALRDAVGSVTRTVPGGQVLVRAGVR